MFCAIKEVYSFYWVYTIVMMLVFGFALSTEVKNSHVAVLDYSNDETSRLLIDKIDQSKYFSVRELLSDESEIEPAFRNGNVRMVIIFPLNFQRSLRHSNAAQVRLIGDASDPNTSNIMINYASAIIGDYQNTLFGEEKLPYQIKVEARMLYNPQLKGAYSFVPGVMTLILMLLGAMMTSVSIVKEKEMGTMEILLVSPMKPILVVISKAVPYLALCFVDVLLILAMAVFVFRHAHCWFFAAVISRKSFVYFYCFVAGPSDFGTRGFSAGSDVYITGRVFNAGHRF